MDLETLFTSISPPLVMVPSGLTITFTSLPSPLLSKLEINSIKSDTGETRVPNTPPTLLMDLDFAFVDPNNFWNAFLSP